MENKTKIIVLAAGKGTRMRSDRPKALVELHGEHMIAHLLRSVAESGLDKKPIIVVGYQKELIMRELGSRYEYVVQEEQLGTGHAVMAAEKACKGAENVIVISADQPFIKPETIQGLLKKHLDSQATLSISTTLLPDFEGWRKAFLTYGRIIRENEKIIDKEIKDCTEEELKIREVNVSCFAFKADWLWDNLKKLDRNLNAQKEYQLTDLWKIASDNGEKIANIQIDAMETLGVNSKEELEILEKLMVK